MKFRRHSHLEGSHAFLSASKPHWVNYPPEKLEEAYMASLAAQRGTRLHAYAHEAIQLRRRQPDNHDSVSQYINDAIGFGLTSEQTLFVSYNCFGTADTIGFRQNFLRVHDLKTGVGKTSFRQHRIYNAMFCLEYGVSPFALAGIENRIYQNNEIKIEDPDPAEINQIMDKIIRDDAHIERLREEYHD